MEDEQEVDEAGQHKFLDIHMYLTAALQKTNIGGVALQMAIDILSRKVNEYPLLHSLISCCSLVIFRPGIWISSLRVFIHSRDDAMWQQG